MVMGYSFAWNAGRMPTLTCPSGRAVTLDVINNVPYLPHGDTQFVSPTLDDGEPLPAMPAPGVALALLTVESEQMRHQGASPCKRARIAHRTPGGLSDQVIL